MQPRQIWSDLIEGIEETLDNRNASYVSSVEMYRETVIKYVESGFNKARAARELGIHHRTMEYRLFAIERYTCLGVNDYKNYLQFYFYLLKEFNHADFDS